MKIFLCFVFFSVVSIKTYSQGTITVRDRIFFGGNIGLWADNVYTDIELSPIVGYYITPRFSAGLGATYKYLNYKISLRPDGSWNRLETHSWGGKTFANYVLIHNVGEFIPLGLNFRVFAHSEYEVLRYEGRFFGKNEQKNVWQQNVLAGGGFRLPMGARSSMNITFLWYVFSDPPFPSGIDNRFSFRVSYNF